LLEVVTAACGKLDGGQVMAAKKVLLITGAGRGMGVDIAKAALAAGYAVVATGRNPDKVAQAAAPPTTCSRCRSM
jgi:NAD(P)-dependent dehydrogenase (short-subunit alcohol dehydrogenase family)